MADNFHSIDSEIEEQDQIIEDLANLTTSVNTNTTNISNIDVATINAKLAGTSSSGLKTLINGNDTDIANIQTKTDFISITQNCDLDQMESDIATNNAKVGITATEQGKLSNISVSSSVNLNTMNTNITTNTNAIDAIEVKTDFLTITQNVNLDTVENDTLNNLLDIQSIKTKTDLITVNGDDIYFGDKNIGINNTNPNADLEIGDSSDVVRVRLNGQNGLAISSELLFTDALLNNITPYFNGMGFQYNSSDNRLHVISDGNDDGTATKLMTFDRANEFVGINDTSPDYRLDVNGDINTSEEFRFYGNPLPMIIAKTSLHSATVSTHRLGYGQGINNTGGSITENTFYMPDTNFRVAFRPTSSIVYIEIDYFMDRYFSGRNLVWALGTSSSNTSIIGKTVTVCRGGNSEWTSRKEKVRIHLSGLTPYSFYVRYIFVKAIVVASDNTIGTTGGNTGWIHYGGHGTHSDGGGQTIGHYETDSSPQTPSNSDNFGPLEATVYSVPSTFTSSSSTTNPFQYIGY